MGKPEKCYGTAGRQFIDYLLSEGYRQRACDLFEENKTEVKKLANGSQNIPGALILTADALAEELIFNDGIRLTVEDLAAYLKSDVVQDMYEQTHDTIAQWIITNKRSIIPQGKQEMPNGGQPIGRRMLHKDRNVYVILRTELQAMMQAKGLKLNGYLAWAVKNGKIMTSKDGRSYTVNVKFGSGSDAIQAACYAFPADQLNAVEEDDDIAEAPCAPEMVSTVGTVGTRKRNT